jgi:16S rRNA (cytosine1402-N4)-methyltransferase
MQLEILQIWLKKLWDKMMTMEYHNPVLLKETVDGLNIVVNGIYVDVTFGGGGHSKEILKQLGKDGRLFAFDQDQDALKNTIDDERFTLINENFRHMKRFLRFHGVKQVDGILADFGVSSHQFDVAERGFSTRFEADLDMRMNQQNELSAYHVINEYAEDKIRQVLWQYGELRQAPAMARVIVEHRTTEEIKTSEQLKTVLKRFLQHKKENKVLAQIFQAIRIEVNQEIEALKEFLLQTPEVLKPQGRLSVISYHSLEDRLVKRFIRNGMFEGEPERDMFGNFEVPLKKVGGLIIPSQEEINQNNRARSAKLRIAEKL